VEIGEGIKGATMCESSFDQNSESSRMSNRSSAPPKGSVNDDAVSQDTGVTANEGEAPPVIPASVQAAIAESAAVRIVPGAPAEGARSTRASRSRSATPSVASSEAGGSPKRPRLETSPPRSGPVTRSHSTAVPPGLPDAPDPAGAEGVRLLNEEIAEVVASDLSDYEDEEPEGRRAGTRTSFW